MEPLARIKIDELLKVACWRFFANENGPANIKTEYPIDLKPGQRGEADYVLLDKRNRPLVVIEAKNHETNPLTAKDQARDYAENVKARFVILSNGDTHYWWDLEQGNPELIAKFPSPDTLQNYGRDYQPDPLALVNEQIKADYIALTQSENYARDPSWLDPTLRDQFMADNNLKFLRPYQLEALRTIQNGVKQGQSRFLFEMATGTGKTLLAAAVIKLFLQTSNAQRVLFLVDRLELENQAKRNFKELLGKRYETMIYKENRPKWHKADIVVTTIQTLLANESYKQQFSPTDFDLVISDEAHRALGERSRPVLEYFKGYKLGLTATPKDYLRGMTPQDEDLTDAHFSRTAIQGLEARDLERRMLLDTYRTFGCESGTPTFRYALLDGVADGFLTNPHAVDARTNITTKLLSEQGYAALTTNDEGEITEQCFTRKEYEKGFFSEPTNRRFCQTIICEALTDPLSHEMGKTIVFCVSQDHACKITQYLNEYADQRYPGQYKSDFARQVTSKVKVAQQLATSFRNNNLGGESKFREGYKTCKTRVCVTVGMMTTGYDCPDLLNIVLFRPIFSPTDFVQIKGRGTRKHTFKHEWHDQWGDRHIDRELYRDREREAWARFTAQYQPDPSVESHLRNIIAACLKNDPLRQIIKNKQFTQLHTTIIISDWTALDSHWRGVIMEWL